MPNGDLTNLAKYGLAGVCIALIALVAFVLSLHFKSDSEGRSIDLRTNTILQEMQGALRENSKVIDDLNDTIDDWIRLNGIISKARGIVISQYPSD